MVYSESEEERAKMIKELDLNFFVCGWSRYELDEYITEKTLAGMIYHGIGVKPSYWTDNHPRLNIRFVEGIYRMDQLRSHGVDKELVLTGFTKLDPLFYQNPNFENFRSQKKS